MGSRIVQSALTEFTCDHCGTTAIAEISPWMQLQITRFDKPITADSPTYIQGTMYVCDKCLALPELQWIGGQNG